MKTKSGRFDIYGNIFVRHRNTFNELNADADLYPVCIPCRFDRVANENVEICGIDLPKGQIVTFLPYAMHHNPLYWQDPETFRPERYH